MAANFNPDRALREWLDHLRDTGRVRHVGLCDYDQSVRFDFILPNGRDFHAQLTRSELEMGGPEELWRWARHVERGIVHESERGRHEAIAAEPRSYTATEVLMRRAEYDRMRHMQAEQARAQQESMLEAMRRQMDAGTYQALMLGEWSPRPRDQKAEKRAQDLFKLACGEEAFRTLEQGCALPITGSKGTKYTLHRRASYCIERVSDGARLCAVVPNVPLWDHLLGIKLMVENDEEKFLKTANVAGGRAGEVLEYGGRRLAGRGLNPWTY